MGPQQSARRRLVLEKRHVGASCPRLISHLSRPRLVPVSPPVWSPVSSTSRPRLVPVSSPVSSRLRLIPRLASVSSPILSPVSFPSRPRLAPCLAPPSRLRLAPLSSPVSSPVSFPSRSPVWSPSRLVPRLVPVSFTSRPPSRPRLVPVSSPSRPPASPACNRGCAAPVRVPWSPPG